MSLCLKSISLRFGGHLALDNISLEIPHGGLTGMIGPNGAGKSTLFAVISGFEAPIAGEVWLEGRDISKLGVAARVRQGLGRTFQVPREFASLSVRENLMVAAQKQSGEGLISLFFQPRRIAAEETGLREKADQWLSFLNLARVADQLAGGLSGGQRKLLELGRALMAEPRMILLDEPFAGVNPVLIEEIGEKIQELNRRGLGFFIVEHNLPVLSRLVGEMHVLDQGRHLASGRPEAVLANPAVREAYMGGAA